MFFFIRGSALAAIVAILLVAGFSFHQDLDWRFFSLIHHSSKSPSLEGFAVIDIPYDEDRVRFRSKVGALLTELSKQKGLPDAVVLDMWFEQDSASIHYKEHPCSNGHELRPQGIEGLEQGLCALRSRAIKEETAIPVYAVTNPFDLKGNLTSDYMNNQVAEIYQMLLDGTGHTRLDRYGSIIKYDPQLDLGNNVAVTALPIKIAEDLYKRPITEINSPIIIVPGTNNEFMSRVLTYEDGQFHPYFDPTAPAIKPKFSKQLVLIGSFAKDKLAGLNRHGPEMLGWAIAERASGDGHDLQSTLLKSPKREYMFYFLLLTLPLGTLFLFNHLYQSKRQWRLQPFKPAAFAAMSMLLLFAAIVGGELLLTNRIFPQVTLISQLIISVSIVSWLYTWMVISKLNVENSHDGFISYSHTTDGNETWVADFSKKLQLKLDRKDKKFFLDQSDIKQQTPWKISMDDGLISSKVFIVIITDDYLKKPWCRYELGVALRRNILNDNNCKVHILIRGEMPTFPWYMHFSLLKKKITDNNNTILKLEDSEFEKSKKIEAFIKLIDEEQSMPPKYVKLQTPTHVEFAVASGVLTTLEGDVAYQSGDALMTGVQGERWPISRAKFESVYEPALPSQHGNVGMYVKKRIVVEAEQKGVPFEVKIQTDRTILKGNIGDWLITSPTGDQWVVADEIFKKTYVLVTDN